MSQKQAAELRMSKDGRDMKRCIAGDVRAASLRSTGQQKLRHAVVGTADCVVKRSSALVILKVDVGV